MSCRIVKLPKDVEESRRVQKNKDVRAQPGQCFANAYRTVMFLPKFGDATYVEGFAVTPSGLCMEHAWVERDGRIIDPTLPDDDLVYFGGLRFNGAAELESAMLTIPKRPGCEDLPILYRFGWGGKDSPDMQEAWKEAVAYSNNRGVASCDTSPIADDGDREELDVQ